MAAFQGPHLKADTPLAPAPAGAAIGWAHTLLGLVLLVVVFVNFANAVGRYLFGIAPVGADEFMVYAIIWSVMLSAILSLVLRSHINVNLLPSYAHGRTLHLLHILQDLVAIIACGYATYASWLFVGRISRLGVTSMGLGLPMAVPHTALLAGFAGLTLAGAVMLVRDCLAWLRIAQATQVSP